MDMKNCTAGFARVDMTPFLGVPLSGYYDRREMNDVAAPLYVNAVGFGQDDRSAVLIAVDTEGIHKELGRAMHRRVADALGLAPECVFISCTHTHTGPIIHCNDDRDFGDPQYDAFFERRLCDAARMALDDRKPVTDVRTAQGEAPGITFVRRHKMKDGHYQTWGSPKDVAERAGEGDDSLRVVRVLRQDAPEIVLINFQLHPDDVGGCACHPDFPGVLRELVESRRENTNCIFFNGAEGQMVANDWIDPDRFFGKKSVERAEYLGEKLAGYALPLLDAAESTGQVGLSCARASARCKTKRELLQADPNLLVEAERIIALHESGRDEEIQPSYELLPFVSQAYVLRGLDKLGLDWVDVPVSAVAFCGVAFLGIAGEPFNEMGKAIRANSPFQTTCVCCLTNGGEGYYATAEAYDQGGYEPRNSRFLKGVAETLTQTSVDLLKSM